MISIGISRLNGVNASLLGGVKIWDRQGHLTDPADRRRECSACPIAGTLDLLGDRWTPIVIRDMLKLAKRRFSEFRASPEGLPTNVLADRLQRLARNGLAQRRRNHERPPRWEYPPTQRAHDLGSMLDALSEWGATHLDTPGGDDA